jgi:hypothetical protein
MSPSAFPPLPSRYRFQADLIGAACGILCFPLAFIIACWHPVFSDGLSVLLPVIGLSLAAGFITALRPANISSPPHQAFSFAVRAGARSGLLSALVACAMTVLATRVSFSPFAAWMSLLASALSILPGAFFGMLGSAFATAIRPPLQNSNDGALPSGTNARTFPVMPCAVTLALVGFGSPLIPKSPEPVTPGKHTEAPIAAPHAVPTPQPFRYAMPAGLATADASRWQVQTVRSIGRIADRTPAAFSPNSEFLAYVTDGNPSHVAITNLNTATTVATFTPPSSLSYLSFSPDSQRLFFVTNDEPHRIGIFEIAGTRSIILPQPKNAAVPDGEVFWWTNEEVAFFLPDQSSKVLSLETLELDDLSASPKWKSLSEAQQKKWQTSPLYSLPASAAWKFEPRLVIGTAETPETQGTSKWPIQSGSALAVTDRSHVYSHLFPDIDMRPNDRFIGASDGSKIVRIRDHQAVAFYFTTRETQPLVLKVKMPNRPEEDAQKQAIAPALSDGVLCAMIYAPLVNPLNQKVIGPDRQQVKGLVRFASWKGQDAELWLDEEFQTVSTGDVVADLHTWTNSVADLIPALALHRWWTQLDSIENDSRDIAKLPARHDAEPLRSQLEYAFMAHAGILRLEGASRPASRSVASLASSAPSPTLSSLATPKPAGDEATSESDTPETAVRLFISRHHVKSNLNGWTTMMDDYADKVNYLNNGVVDRAFILKDETLSRRKFTRYSENITSAIVVTRLSPARFEARYKLSFNGTKTDNQPYAGISDTILLVELTPHGPKIVQQKANVTKQLF